MSVSKSAHRGCYLANPDIAGFYPEWCFGSSTHEYDEDMAPEIAIDPDDGILSFINCGSATKTYFATIENAHKILTSTGVDLLSECVQVPGHNYITFVGTVRPHEMLSIAQLVPRSAGRRIRQRDFESIKITSDVQDYVQAGSVSSSFEIQTFPLLADHGVRYLCTQEAGGSLTHFAHPSTYHAVDFRCDIGTPVVAIFDAEVIEIRNETNESGVHVNNLFHWNSIMIKHLDSNTYAEYVHVKKDTFTAKVGDTVTRGQIICLSGNAGFCPEPHLHFELHSSPDPGNASIPITYKGERFVVDQFYS